jgi:hypothetical protein
MYLFLNFWDTVNGTGDAHYVMLFATEGGAVWFLADDDHLFCGPLGLHHCEARSEEERKQPPLYPSFASLRMGGRR